jgi:hypothetical protein
MIRPILTIAAGVVFSGAAFADGTWSIVSPFPGGAVGYEMNSVVPGKAHGHTLMTTMLYVSQPQNFDGKNANFMVQDVEYDCDAKTALSKSLQAFDIDGKPVGSTTGTEWTPLSNNPWLDLMSHTACDGLKLKDGVMADNRDAAMQKMKTLHKDGP